VEHTLSTAPSIWSSLNSMSLIFEARDIMCITASDMSWSKILGPQTLTILLPVSVVQIHRACGDSQDHYESPLIWCGVREEGHNYEIVLEKLSQLADALFDVLLRIESLVEVGIEVEDFCRDVNFLAVRCVLQVSVIVIGGVNHVGCLL
jgi:hypothetical protein